MVNDDRIEYKKTRELIDGLHSLMNSFGDLRISNIIDTLENNAPIDKYHICPKCNGSGIVKVTYNKYPSNLPDSGFVYEEGIKEVKCNLCDGTGYNQRKLVPKFVQDGWKVEE